jgi:hypothetical protein
MVFVALWRGESEKQNHKLDRGGNEVGEVEKERAERKRDWERLWKGVQ